MKMNTNIMNPRADFQIIEPPNEFVAADAASAFVNHQRVQVSRVDGIRLVRGGEARWQAALRPGAL
jgi:hypothetical protein